MKISVGFILFPTCLTDVAEGACIMVTGAAEIYRVVEATQPRARRAVNYDSRSIDARTHGLRWFHVPMFGINKSVSSVGWAHRSMLLEERLLFLFRNKAAETYRMVYAILTMIAHITEDV